MGAAVLVGRVDQCLELERAVGRGPVADRDHVLEAAPADELLCERPQRLVDDQHPVAGVGRDVRVVVGVQAEVEGVRDEPARRCPDVRLEVLVVVPHERRHPVAVLEPEAS